MNFWWKHLDTFKEPYMHCSGDDFFNLDNWLHKIELCGYHAGRTNSETEERRLEIQAEDLRDLVTQLFIQQYVKHIKTKRDALLNIKNENEVIREYCKRFLRGKL